MTSMSFNIDKMISPFIKALPPSGLAKFLEITANNPNIVPLSVGEPDFDILNKIADIFQVDADYLLGRSSLSHEPEPVTIAAHLDTSDLTQAELDDVEKYIQFIRSKRKQ